jgi:hypothetical protein
MSTMRGGEEAGSRKVRKIVGMSKRNDDGDEDDDADEDEDEGVDGRVVGEKDMDEEEEERKDDEDDEDEDEDEEDEEEDIMWRKEKALKMTKPALIDECVQLRNSVKRAHDAVLNEVKNREKVQRDYELLSRKVSTLEREIAGQQARSSSSSSFGTTSVVVDGVSVTERRQVVVVEQQDYSSEQKLQLGKFIRDKVFRTYKVTNKQSFEDKKIAIMCHGQLDRQMQEASAVAVYGEALMKLVQTELGQKRNKVNNKLLEKWAGK